MPAKTISATPAICQPAGSWCSSSPITAVIAGSRNLASVTAIG